MAKPIIEIEGIGKCYRIGTDREKYLSLRDELAKSAKGFSSRFLARHQKIKKEEEYWALKDVSFSIQEGEAVGIVGRNGAGKSTLLKILSKITPPTAGKITLRGRMASLLEVGTGFHPELTGRENIYLNGAILGMTRAEIRRKFDEIITFAEVEKFLDTPVKRYSSGMYVRLAFAVAAHLEPEILIVDEVLAVGDAEFQKKCLGRMSEVAKEGRTVLFVSHNMGAITTLCHKAVLLEHGKFSYMGSVNETVGHYIRKAFENSGKITFSPPTSTGTEQIVRLIDVKLLNRDGIIADTFTIGEPITICCSISSRNPVREILIGIIIRSAQGTNIFHCHSSDAKCRIENLHGTISIKITFSEIRLYPGSYVIGEFDITLPEGDIMDSHRDFLGFTIIEGGSKIYRRLFPHAALVHEVPSWTLSETTEHSV